MKRFHETLAKRANGKRNAYICIYNEERFLSKPCSFLCGDIAERRPSPVHLGNQWKVYWMLFFFFRTRVNSTQKLDLSLFKADVHWSATFRSFQWIENFRGIWKVAFVFHFVDICSKAGKARHKRRVGLLHLRERDEVRYGESKIKINVSVTDS